MNDLQDHPATLVAYLTEEEFRDLSITGQIYDKQSRVRVPAVLQYLVNKTGPLATTGCDHGAFLSTIGVGVGVGMGASVGVGVHVGAGGGGGACRCRCGCRCGCKLVVWGLYVSQISLHNHIPRRVHTHTNTHTYTCTHTCIHMYSYIQARGSQTFRCALCLPFRWTLMVCRRMSR